MRNERKNNSKYSSASFLCSLLILITSHIYGNDVSTKKFCNTLTVNQDTTVPIRIITDTVPVKNINDTLPATDSLVTSDTLSLNLSKDSLDQPIDYSASDSIVFIIPEKKLYYSALLL